MTTSFLPRRVAVTSFAVAFFAFLPAMFYNLVSAATYPAWFWVLALVNIFKVPILFIWVVVEMILWAVVYFYGAAFIGRWVTDAPSKLNQTIRLSSVLASVLGVTALPIYCGTGIGVPVKCHTYWSLVRELLAK